LIDGTDQVNRPNEIDRLPQDAASAALVGVGNARTVHFFGGNQRRDQRMRFRRHAECVPPRAVQKRHVGQEDRGSGDRQVKVRLFESFGPVQADPGIYQDGRQRGKLGAEAGESDTFDPLRDI
jgi:hypothetical protein